MRTLRYARSLNFASVFSEVGNFVNVFVPAACVAPDAPGLVDQLVYGGRPYSPSSDTVAMMCHMGILYPSDKPKKGYPNALRTAMNALRFAPGDLAPEEHRRLDDDFKFAGVVVTVVATPPVDEYPSSPGYGIASQSAGGGDAFSVNIIDFHFVSEFVPMPPVSDDPAQCVGTDAALALYAIGDESDTAFSVPCLPELFDGELFRDFDVAFVVDDESREALVVCDAGAGLALKRTWDGDGERREDVVLEPLAWGAIVATQQGLEIGEFRSPPILRVVLTPKDVPE
jgi:hypothetical protein